MRQETSSAVPQVLFLSYTEPTFVKSKTDYQKKDGISIFYCCLILKSINKKNPSHKSCKYKGVVLSFAILDILTTGCLNNSLGSSARGTISETKPFSFLQSKGS